MPTTTYMVVDARHDHSIRIPRPDLPVRLGTPNACANCHPNESAQWAADRVKAWYGQVPKGHQSWAQIMRDARDGRPGTGAELAALIRNLDTPDIARARALSGTMAASARKHRPA
jgi:hypothetical protein